MGATTLLVWPLAWAGLASPATASVNNASVAHTTRTGLRQVCLFDMGNLSVVVTADR
jgi:hypothetical protein